MMNVSGDGILMVLGNVGVLAFFGMKYINKIDTQGDISTQIVTTLELIQENLKKDNERSEKMFQEVFDRVKELEEVKTIHDLFMEKSECPMFSVTRHESKID